MSAFGGCSHWPEVEAAGDGRFGPRELERVQRHLAQCAQCRDDRDRLEALRAEARGRARAPVSEMHRHRARAALLRAAVHPVEGPRRGRLVTAFALALAATLLGVGALRRPASPRAPQAQVDVVASAQWSRTSTATLETVRLTEGSLRVRVPHQHAGHRFVVALPDGELEVRGTQFVVEARGGRTQRVTVFEGLVALRIGHGTEQLIAAGGHWQATPPGVVAASAPVLALPPTPSVPVTPVVSVNLPPRRVPAPRPVLAAPPTSTGFEAFAAGVEALGRGDFATAAEAFGRFERAQPGDERAEDAAWLRVVALRRGGDESRALAAAEHYLEAYGTGAHRPEAAILCARTAFARGDCARVEALANAEGSAANAVEWRTLRARCVRDAGAR